MRTFRVLLLVAVVTAGGLAVLAPSAHASAPAVSAKVKKFCKASEKISSSTPDDSDSAAAQQLARTTRKAANAAPTTRVKNALKDMATYFDAIGDAGNNPADLGEAIGKLASKYAKAAAIYTGYYIGHCSGVS
jgi:hypothetical protein